MYDAIYKSEEVPSEFHPIFEQLQREFGSKCEIWRRVENFGRKLFAGVLNPSTEVAVTVLLRDGSRKRASSLSSTEIQRIREHLASTAKDDLVL